jgi:molecular chaperone DnaJ
VDVPEGAQPGQHVVLRGLGLPSLRGAARGDQHVVLDVRVPAGLTKRQRDLAEELDESLGGGGNRGSDGGRIWRRR